MPVSDCVALTAKEAREIQHLFTEMFKGKMDMCVAAEEVYKPGEGYSRRGAPDPVPTGTYHLHLSIPTLRFGNHESLTPGTMETYQLIADTLAEHGVAKKMRISSKRDMLAGTGLYDDDPQPTPIMPLAFTTNNIQQIKAALDSALEVTKQRQNDTEKACKLLNAAAEKVAIKPTASECRSYYKPKAEFKVSDNLGAGKNQIVFRADYWMNHHPEGEDYQVWKKLLEPLEKAGVVKMEDSQQGFIVFVPGLKQLEAKLDMLVKLETQDRQKAARR